MSTGAGEDGEQLTLVPESVRAAARPRSPAPALLPAEQDPVAEVVVDVSLAHLDRRFEYAVPHELADAAVPGARVKVRFAGQDRSGFVVCRKEFADHPGRLTPLRRVVSAEPVLSADLLRLCQAVADRWAGALSDVLRLAVPPRHAQAEAEEPGAADERPQRPGAGPWSACPGGSAFLDHLARGGAPRAVWTATPSAADPSGDWPRALAVAALTAAAAGRGALVVLPDVRDVARVDAALRAEQATRADGGNPAATAHVLLTADLGPQARYRAWLRVARGQTCLVVGTRAAMFAPVHDLGLVVVWDDGDDLHAEPMAPYPHVREVLALRAEQQAAAVLVGGFVRTAEGERMVRTGWARAVGASRADLRAGAPRVALAGEGHEPERDAAAASARLPSLAWRTASAALKDGPVLVQVPRRGYVPSVSCLTCRTPARCSACHGPLGLGSGSAPPSCRWCGVVATAWACPECGDRRVRSVVVGARRTAEELGRAFPGVQVLTSGGGEVLPAVGRRPALVIATPGAEPVADGGYAAALLLDAWASLGREDLRAAEEALRRWMNAAALVRSGGDGGRVVLVAPGSLPPVEALARWAPAWHAGAELDAREALGFPPARTVVTLTGAGAAVQDLRDALDLPADVEVLGPVAAPGGTWGAREAGREAAQEEPAVRLLLRAAPARRVALSQLVRQAAASRSARKRPGSVRVQVDPLDLV